MFRYIKFIVSILFLVLISLHISTKNVASQHVEISTDEKEAYIEQVNQSTADKTIEYLLAYGFADINQAAIYHHKHSFHKGKHQTKVLHGTCHQEISLKRNNKSPKFVGYHRSHDTAYYIYTIEHIII